jgi:hypothetical protein
MGVKSLLVAPVRAVLRATAKTREGMLRLYWHAALAADLKYPLPGSVVCLGRAWVFGTGAVRFGERTLLYPEAHLETQEAAEIVMGHGIWWRWQGSRSGAGR